MRKRIQVVVVALIEKDGKYLLTKRYDPKNKATHNRWQMPGGGLEFDETVEQCAVREVKEETGLDVTKLKLIPKIHEKIFFASGWHGVAIGFLCIPLHENQKIVLNREATEYGWYTLDEIEKLKLHHGTASLISVVSKSGVEERT